MTTETRVQSSIAGFFSLVGLALQFDDKVYSDVWGDAQDIKANDIGSFDRQRGLFDLIR